MAPVTYIAKPLVKIGGREVSTGFLEDILQISVEESLHLPGMFTLMLRNDYASSSGDDVPWKHEDFLAIGKSVELGFISSTTDSDEFDEVKREIVLKGEITAIETHFTPESQAPIMVRGYDVSHRLHRGRHSRSFQNETDAKIVERIATEVGIPLGTIDSTPGPYGYQDIGGSSGYIFQENQTNMEFLRSRATRHGYELFVQDGQLHFRKPCQDGTLQLEWRRELQSFRVQVTSAEQVDSVEVRGWDYSQKQAIVSSSSSEAVLTDTQQGRDSHASSRFQAHISTPKLIVVDQIVSHGDEAQTIADALGNELGGEFVQADARSDGNPQIRPGKVVELTNMGPYSGSYYITETRHLYFERIYTTEFSVRGLRGGDLLQTLSPSARLHPGQTCLIGIVADNNDPNGWGRVRVTFPTLTEEHMSNWARVVAVGAGADRGVDWLPEINDEVLVAFEHGDIHRPYVLGGVWNGQDAPPEKPENSVASGQSTGKDGNGGTVRLRTLKSRTGHKLQFVEEDKDEVKQGVYLETQALNVLHLNDTDQYIELKSKDGHQTRLDDKEQKLELKSKGGHLLNLDDKGSKLELTSTGDCIINAGTSGKSKSIDLNGGSLTLTGASTITLKVGTSSITLKSSGIEIKGGSVTVNGSMNATLEGGKTDVKGKMVSVQGTAMTTVEGKLLKLN